MAGIRKTMQNFKDVPIIQPASITTAQGGNYNFVSLRDCQNASIVIRTGALSGAAPACTLQQAKNIEGNGNKALSFAKVWENHPNVSNADEVDLWTEVDVTSDTFNLAASCNYRIEIDCSKLDVSNGFDCIRPHFAAPGTSLVYSVSIELHNLRYQGEGKLNQHGARVNR